ncbi:MAG: GNAT family N-acetyltransferase [Bryobacterales bacterium]|nr:GNAT family N-acetyltransferase [Bryobacterales bacterium]
MQPGNEVLYSIGTPSESDEMVCLLGETFALYDPPAVAAGLTPPEFEHFVRLLCPHTGRQGLTIIARSAETGEMMGAPLAEDAASHLPAGLESLSAKFDLIFDILGQLDTEYRSGRTVSPGESLHLFLLGVARRFAGQGIARQLVAECVANGIRKGYHVAVTEATNRTSQHIFRKLGFHERVRRSCFDHRFDGQAVFASIAAQGGPILMDKSLSRGPAIAPTAAAPAAG